MRSVGDGKHSLHRSERCCRAQSKDTMARVACIEEDAGLRQMLKMVLSEAGWEIICRGTGENTSVCPWGERPDLLVLDLDGYRGGISVIEALRGDPETANVAMIVCSGNLTLIRARERRLRGLGCAMLEKPFNLDQLLATVRRAEALVPHRLDPDDPPTAAFATTAPPSAA